MSFKNNMVDHIDISVIVPVYNSESYLQKCLKSLTCQNKVICEFICVDDGSTDKSLDIIKKFVLTDTRFKLITKNHEGTSSARNAGLNLACGKYVCFLDSDDRLKKGALFALFHTAENYRCDVVKFNAKLINGQYWVKKSFLKHDELIRNFSEEDIFIHKDCRPFIWCHFIKRDIISNQRFNRTLEIGEDQEFIIRYLHYAKTVLFISKKYYIHYNHTNSSMNRCTMDRICEEHIKMVKAVSLDINNKTESYKTWVLDTLYYSFTNSNKNENMRIEITKLLISEKIIDTAQETERKKISLFLDQSYSENPDF